MIQRTSSPFLGHNNRFSGHPNPRTKLHQITPNAPLPQQSIHHLQNIHDFPIAKTWLLDYNRLIVCQKVSVAFYINKITKRGNVHMKKVAFSVIATGSLALFVGTDDAEASSYQVKAGDSLWKIALENNVSVSTLKQLNALTSDVIFPNQTLQIASTTAKQPVQNKPAQVTQSKPSGSTSTYTVKSGDTLSRIASQHKTTVVAIQQLNNISNHLIYAGQQLKVSGTAQAPAQSTPAVTHTSTSSTNFNGRNIPRC